MSNQPAYARHSCILTMPLIAFIALAQDTFPKLHIEGEFLPYSASAPTPAHRTQRRRWRARILVDLAATTAP
jgi:hypothetical protein